MTADDAMPYVTGVCRGDDNEGEPCGECLLCRVEATEVELARLRARLRDEK